MLVKLLPALVLCASMLISASSVAQEISGGKWWCTPRIVDTLKLSDEQLQRLDESYQKIRRELIEARANLERERVDLDAVMARDPLEDEVVMKHFQSLEAARTRLASERFTFIVQVRKVIGQDRFEKLRAIFNDRKSRLAPDTE